jgi:type I restriction-modification system DNA methylase subunit
MPITFDRAQTSIAQLAAHFKTNQALYHAPTYKEAQARQEFIDQMFVYLGWDVYNEERAAPQYREVEVEPTQEIEGEKKAPDYVFRIGAERKFFVEAKKPGVSIKSDAKPAYQVRRYAWSAKLPLSLLTDFEELAVYDCRTRPFDKDQASVARINFYTFDEYPDRWKEIWDVFSREAVRGGSFDQYMEHVKGKRGTATVDAEFLKEIEGWRDALARNLALRNPKLSIDELNDAVQRTIDRIIFLRMAEDRGIEAPDRLLALTGSPKGYSAKGQGEGESIYAQLLHLFQQADAKYNSGLFDFAADQLTGQLSIDDKVLKPIIADLYYPNPYEFSVMPAEILGNVYEQFLGKVIRLTAAHQAKVEEKPEVKKAGGVYYTPAYIVDYIVKQTVGQQIEGKTPRQLESVRVLDMACGSGSFLLGAYQFLLDYYLKWYLEHEPQKHSKAVTKIGDAWRLTTAERKRILLAHIYGVDIDRQAVEVTKLSLLLKVLEGENEQSLQMELFARERALPNLDRNIKCGNSLIGPDYFGNQLMSDPEEYRRVNPFDWQSEFPDAVKAGGFDCIIGNPPYGFHQIHDESIKPYFKQHYAAAQGSFEHYFLFYERTLTLLKKDGLHGFITPVTWLTIPSARSLRKFILGGFSIQEISWLPEMVFRNAQVNTLISIIKRSEPNEVTIRIYDTLGFQKPPMQERVNRQQSFNDSDYYIGIFENKSEERVITKIVTVSRPLGDFARPCSGYNPYEVGKGQDPNGGLQTANTVRTKPYHSEKKLNKDWKPEIIGRNLSRYSVDVTGKRWIKYGSWLAAQRDPSNFTGKRILIQEITGGQDRRIIAAYFDGELYHSRDVIPIKIENDLPNPLYLLAIINSKLITWYHHKRNPKAQKGLFPKVLVSDVSKLPIRTIDFTDAQDKARHDRMVALVEKMLALHQQLPAAHTAHDRDLIQRQIDATDRAIDALVYELYGLTAEEIKIVEGTA